MRTPLAPYRIPLIARLEDEPELDLIVAHGGGSLPPDYGSIRLAGEADLMQVRNVGFPGGGLRVIWQRGVRTVLVRPADVVMLPDIAHNVSVWWALLHAKRSGRGVVIFGYGFRPKGVSPWWVRPFRDVGRRLMYRFADVVTTYTDAGAAGVSKLGVPSDQVIGVSNTLDVEYLRSIRGGERTDETRHRLGLGVGHVLLFVGRMQPVKRVDLLVEAFRYLRSQIGDVRLLAVGDGEQRRLLDSEPGVITLDETYDPRSLAPLFELASLLVMPGRVGLTCVHAFAYGVPVVTCHPDEVQQSPEFEYLEDGFNSIVVDGSEARELAGHIRDLLQDEARLRLLSENAYETGTGLEMGHMVTEILRAWRTADLRARSKGTRNPRVSR